MNYEQRFTNMYVSNKFYSRHRRLGERHGADDGGQSPVRTELHPSRQLPGFERRTQVDAHRPHLQ